MSLPDLEAGEIDGRLPEPQSRPEEYPAFCVVQKAIGKLSRLHAQHPDLYEVGEVKRSLDTVLPLLRCLDAAYFLAPIADQLNTYAREWGVLWQCEPNLDQMCRMIGNLVWARRTPPMERREPLSGVQTINEVIGELNRRIRRTTTTLRTKHKEMKFQDQRVHEAKKAAFVEMLSFAQDLKAAWIEPKR